MRQWKLGRVLSVALMMGMSLGSAVAQSDTDRLAEACKLHKSSGERMKCMEALLRLTSKGAQQSSVAATVPATSAQGDDTRHEAASRAALAQAFNALVEVNNTILARTQMDYYRYRTLVSKPATAVNVVRTAELTQAGREAYAAMQEAMRAYKDAGDFWAGHGSFLQDPRNRTLYIDAVPLDRTNMLWMTERYGVEQKKADLLGLLYGVKLNDGLTAVWNKANASVSAAAAYMKSGELK